jgi:hypothetical protein
LKYVEFRKLGMSKDNSYTRVMGLMWNTRKAFWSCYQDLSHGRVFVLLEGFWSSSNWRANYERASICTIVDFEDPENLVIPPYCGPRSMHCSLNTIAYTPFHNLFVGNFVLVWPLNPTIYLV